MKRKLFTVAFLFICAVFLVLSATHVFDERNAAPVFVPRRIERRMFPPTPRVLS